MLTKGFTINGKHSYADYGLQIKKRVIGFPAKQSIRKTVPFMSGYHDFTRINGSDTWGERPLSYVFDIIGDTVEEVDAECTRILNWLGNIHDADIYDDTMPDIHFHGSFDSAAVAESEDGEQNELTVNFVCQPFKYANAETVVEAFRGTVIESIIGSAVRPTIEAISGGYWYYRLNGAPIEENIRANFSAGVSLSPYVINAGEYIFGFAPSNLLVYPFTSGTNTVNGITFTVNTDGTITANGTATEIAYFTLRKGDFALSVGKYRVTGGKSADIRLRVEVSRGDDLEVLYEAGDGGFILDITEDVTNVAFFYQAAAGAVLDNVTLTPALHGKVRMSWTEVLL